MNDETPRPTTETERQLLGLLDAANKRVAIAKTLADELDHTTNVLMAEREELRAERDAAQSREQCALDTAAEQHAEVERLKAPRKTEALAPNGVMARLDRIEKALRHLAGWFREESTAAEAIKILDGDA